MNLNLKTGFLTLTLLSMQAFLSAPAHAIFDPEWERPLESAQMEISESRGFFERIDDLQVFINKRDGQIRATSLTISYTILPTESLDVDPTTESRTYLLTEDQISKDSCGATLYTINIGEMVDGRPSGARTHISLTDYRTSLCDYVVQSSLELYMRVGYGWCGTMDATVHAFGNPEALATIK